jgi:hypothetical protein
MTGTTLRRASAVTLVLGTVLSTVFASTALAAASASLDREGDSLTLRAESGRAVSGSTSLPADAGVSVRLRGQGEEVFLKSKATTTADDGSFEVTVDLSGVDAASAGPVTVAAIHDGTTLTTTEAQFVTGSSGDGDSSGTGPGFGVLAVLCALVGASAAAGSFPALFFRHRKRQQP